MALKLITPAASYPVTLERAKQHLNVSHSDDDSLITAYLAAATAHAEKFLGRALVEQTWELTLDEFPANEIKIPLPPLIQIVSVKYDDGAGDEQTIDPSGYSVDAVSEPGWLLPLSSGAWPSPFDGINAVRIRFKAGYADEDSPQGNSVPPDICAAVLLTLGTLYANRETVVIGQTASLLPWSAQQLLRFHRIDLSMA